MGGIRDGVDAVKALCLGADAVAFGTSAIIAGGCIACMQCHIGQCVTGIATQDPEHESRYDPEAESHNIHRFLEGVRWQIAALTHALGYTDFRALNRDDLVALTPEAAEITGLPYEPGGEGEDAGAAGAVGLMGLMAVYDINRILVPEAPPEYEDHTRDVHYVPAPCQVACPIGTDAPSYIAHIWDEDYEGPRSRRSQPPIRSAPSAGGCATPPCEPACRRVDSDGAVPRSGT